ncbi:helix-turn-helix domain-containing protein [Tsukamurella paurometabola]|uniref:helix-turn-helix domain-containing protein n=1 Tax=Tsukamurella paurometabola TaxID=2061 RepID=UPI000F7EB621|nr:helix-turn-helix transcriptional regulator [Tsukamurella paurometabola]UEA83284.1 helix-turn-helix domain-containing protein [Tsukamurella paurometabola]
MTKLDTLIGARVRQLRTDAGFSQDQLARAAQRAGLTWQKARVTQLEQGKVAAAHLETLLPLAIALGDLLGHPLQLADLIPESEEPVRSALRGTPVTPLLPPLPDPTLAPGWGAVDDRISAELDADPVVVQVAAERLYGTTATVERDRRAGEGANKQRRARQTPLIVAEVAAEIERVAVEEAALDGND